MALLVGFIFPVFSFVYVLYVLLSGWIASLVTADFRERSQIAFAGLMTSLINVTMIILIKFLFPAFYEKRILILDVSWGAVAGIISAIMAIGGLPFLEKIFNITTSLKMLELMDFSQPLLQKLILDAPGTYHHSVVVSNLAEAAARELGADPLLCKVGGYYHDIGKLKRPYFFVENQTGENVHDQLNPNLSALIIISHVKDGVALAKEYSLPDTIISIIREHHGTSLVSYFYNKAFKEGHNNGELEMKFRYPGVKPQTKESAIVMLADSIESAARTLKNPSASQIKNLVGKIINQKFEDGQLDDSNLTMKDLEKLERVFSKILLSMYHARIEYPDEIDRIIKENKGKQDNSKKSSEMKEEEKKDGN
jgi:putative nucleotidyltransferase with HDIG domain